MTLNEKQAQFSYCMGRLLGWCGRVGHRVILAEFYRPPETAALYAERGIGIKGSLHTLKLAGDLFVYRDGAVSWDVEDYRPLGEYWKTLHELARWGGDFPGRDAVHFSLEHRGVR